MVRNVPRGPCWPPASWLFALALAGVVLLVPARALAGGGADHGDRVAALVFALALVLLVAKLGGDLATRLRQPAVLGELLAGVLLGNLPLVGISRLTWLRADPSLDLLAQLGVLILLFEVGLESTVRSMLRVGVASLFVALLGIAAPFALGWGVGVWLLPGASGYVHVFLGATLTATSIGITARVLQDLGRAQSPEARIVLGAAVIDDVLGLVILAVIGGTVAAAGRGGSLPLVSVAMILVKATVFLVGSLALGLAVSPRLFALASRLHGRGVLLAAGLILCFFLSWLAHAIGLAPLVGAFAAGLVLEDVHYRDFRARGERGLEELVHPIAVFLVPVFFVLMGMRTDLRALVQPGIAALSLALIVVAIAGKLLCALVVVGRDLRRLAVAIGMVPRGEVGLIFANLGLTLELGGERLVNARTYAAIVVMVIATTMFTPPALKWSLERPLRPARGAHAVAPGSSERG